MMPGLCEEIGASCECNPELSDSPARLVGVTPRQKATSMPEYRCYFFDAQDHVTSLSIFDLPDDDLARTEADRLWRRSASHGFELGKGAKMIHREVPYPVGDEPRP
jgi:hypothetical protein